jgi:hypothetical protein
MMMTEITEEVSVEEWEDPEVLEVDSEVRLEVLLAVVGVDPPCDVWVSFFDRLDLRKSDRNHAYLLWIQSPHQDLAFWLEQTSYLFSTCNAQ